jgi:hypothetical protein
MDETAKKLHALILREISNWPSELQVDWSELAAILEYERSDTTPDRMRAEMFAYQTLRAKHDATHSLRPTGKR